ncbi:MAG: ribulose-phosphate 3-epimerase [Bryobacter sp.]|nr:ribulose-phosphate 3-epimerase [Bryobacter sp.]
MKNDLQILPSLLAADFARLGEEMTAVEAGGVQMLHYDVMDGRFVPNISMGIPVLAGLRQATRLHLDVHLMIVEPEKYVEAFRDAGADSISVHQETCPHLHRTLEQIRKTGALAGVVLNPGTPVHTLDEVLDMVHFVLVMSVNPGFGGQKFLPSSLKKIAQLAERRRENGYSYAIEIDGGVDLENAQAIAQAGCDWLVAGSSVFRSANRAQAVRDLHARAVAGRLLQA